MPSTSQSTNQDAYQHVFPQPASTGNDTSLDIRNQLSRRASEATMSSSKTRASTSASAAADPEPAAINAFPLSSSIPPTIIISTPRTLLCALALSLLIFTQSSNMSMLTTIQDDIALSLDSYDSNSWFTSSFLIAMSSLGPLNGKLATVFSPRACILFSSVLFGLGELFTSLAETLPTFLLGRAISGTGASGVYTISIVVVLELSGAEGRGLGIGMLNSGYTFGVALGAVAAGGLVAGTGWRALFWMQTPICIFSGLLLYLSIPASLASGKREEVVDSGTSAGKTLRLLRDLDWFGALTLTASIATFLYALASPTRIPLLPVLVSLVVLVIFVLNELYVASDPIIPLALLKSRGLLLTCFSTVGYMTARWAVLFYSPTYALALQGWSPSRAGAILLPTNIAFALGGLAVGWLHIRREGSFYVPTLLTYTLFPLTLVAVAMLSRADTSPWGFVVAVAACGGVTGAALNYTLAHLLHLTPKDTHYVASALLATFRGFAGSFGSAIGGGMFTRTLGKALREGFEEEGLRRDELIRKLLGSPRTVGGLTGVEKHVAIMGYEKALKTLFLAGAALALAMVFVQAGTGWKGANSEPSEDERRPLLRGPSQEVDVS